MYKHGVYSEKQSTALTTTSSIGTIPVYVGTLPIQRINTNGEADYDYSNYINKPIVLSTYNDVKKLGIYSSDWDSYTLCEAISAHFLNESAVVSPIILINALDPNTNVNTTATTVTIPLSVGATGKYGYINDTKCIIDSLTLVASDDSSSIEKGDFEISYEGDTVKLTVTKSGFDKTEVKATYKQIEVSETNLTAETFGKAVDAIDLCEVATGYLPNILAAPYFSSKPAYHQKMIEKVMNKITDKWYLVCVSDIPSDSNVNDFEKAKTWKSENGYVSKYDKVCYPKVKQGSVIYHLSTIATFTMMKTDIDNDDVPYVSPSNKAINASASVLADGTEIYISETEANGMNKVGITTTNIIKRGLRLWGSHMANYNYGNIDSIEADERSDANIRMMFYLLNYLQYNFIDEIDTAFARKDVDGIITSVQQWLNSLVNEGKLLYATINFSESENSTDDMVNGDFVFDVTNTLTPNAKSLTFRVSYTSEGLTLLTEGGSE